MNIFFLKRKRPIHVFSRSRSRQKTLHKKTLTFLFIGVCFFALSILAYKFHNLVPRIPSEMGTLVRPDSSSQDSSVFKKELVRYGIQFESITYATQSSTLIVKLAQDAYAYLDTTLSPSSQVRLLSDILSRVAIDNKGKTLKYIDLTHEKAIVKF